MTSTKETYKTFEATTDKGTPVCVINEGKLKDGTPAYKVQIGKFIGRTQHACSAIYRYNGKIGYIAKTKVTPRFKKG